MTPAEQLIADRIRGTGPLSFADFMAIALHHPEVGYYARQPLPFGAAGDYFTSPELHPAFATLLGRQLEQLWQALDSPRPFVVHESGPGSGRFARDLLDWASVAAPELYNACQYRLAEAGHGRLVRHVDAFSSEQPAHCILANELLDALPVHLVQVRNHRLEELFVTLEGGGLALQPGPPSTPALEAYFGRLGLRPAEGCRAEVNLAALEWMRTAAAGLDRGLLLALDYGYPADRLYSRERRQGTLLCYYRHTLNSDPLARVGEQDMSSHVDFTSLRQAGEAAALTTLGLVSQQRLLHNLGLPEVRRAIQTAPLPQAERAANLRALDQLVDPDGLGRILALVQHRGLDDFVPLGLVGGAPYDWPPLLQRADHLRLPDPAEGESLPDFESQWADFWSEADTSKPRP